MSKAILGKKLGMTQVFTAEGQLVPVTVVETTPSVVVRVKTVETDGYEAVQIGYGSIKEKHLTKPVKGQFDKAGVAPVKYLREVRVWLKVVSQALKVAWLWFATRLNLLNNHLSKGGLCNAYSSNI